MKLFLVVLLNIVLTVLIITMSTNIILNFTLFEKDYAKLKNQVEWNTESIDASGLRTALKER